MKMENDLLFPRDQRSFVPLLPRSPVLLLIPKVKTQGPFRRMRIMLKRALTTRFAIISVMFTVCTMAMFVSCTNDPGTAVSPPAEPVRFVADAEKRLLELNLKYSRADWVKSTNITEDTELLSAEANKAVIEATTELAKEARRFEGQNLTPELDRKSTRLNSSHLVI